MLPTISELFENREIASAIAITNFVNNDDVSGLNTKVLQELHDVISKEKNTGYKQKLTLLFEMIKSRIVPKEPYDDLTYSSGAFDLEITKRKKVYMGKPFQVNQYNLEGLLIKTWISISEASKQTKTSKSAIIRCCKNKQKTANNFIWKYLKD